LQRLHLENPEAVLLGQDREEPVLVAVDIDLLRHLLPEQPNPAADVVKLEFRNGIQQDVKSPGLNPVEERVLPRPPACDYHVAAVQRLDESRDF